MKKMKKLIPILLVFCLLFCSCSNNNEETSLPSEQESTQEPVTTPVIVYRNPLNGSILPSQYTGRVFSVSINNIAPAMPFRGINDADIFFEMFINDYCTRGLAVFSDVKKVPSVGSIRSTRYNFTDISLAYNTVMIHANASKVVLNDMYSAGIDNILADSPIGYRDTERRSMGYAYEHTLFATGESLYNEASARGFNLAVNDKDYGMIFSEDVTLNGSDANVIDILFSLYGREKKTTMKYDINTDSYIFWQYGEQMTDANYNTPASFKNVIVILAPTENNDVYHVANLSGSGDAYFATGGKIVPIKWTHTDDNSPFNFTYPDGTKITQKVGSTYIAIAPTTSPVTYS